MQPKHTIAPWSSKVIETLVTNPYFSVVLQDVKVTDGTQRTYYTIHFPAPSVGIVARRGTDILLLHQYRFIVDEYVWAIPSGGVAPEETPKMAALRELEEETGYAASAISPLLKCYASYGCSDQEFQTYLATGLRHSNKIFDSNEVIDARWFSREEVLKMIDENRIVDNLSLSPILHVLLQDERGNAASSQ